MGKSKDLASGNSAAYVETAGDTMSGNLTASVGITIADDNNLKFGDGTAYIQGSGANDRLKFIANNTEHMRVHSAGYVTTPNQPSFAVSKNNGHVSAGNVYIFNATEYSVGSMYNTSNGRGTAPVAGRYFVSTWLMSEADATYNNKSYGIRKNGTLFKSVYSANGGNNHHQWSWAGIMSLSANDYIDVYANNMSLYGTSGYYSSFCMHLLS